MSGIRTILASSSISIGLLVISLPSLAQDVAPKSADYYELKVRPILANNCYSCHTNSQLGGLRVDSRDALLKGGGRGPAIVPGHAEKSVLITAVRQTDENLKMPMGGNKLGDSDVQTLVAWINAGAVWPAATPPTQAPAGAPNSADFFESKVRPILATSCYTCHTNSQSGGLRVDSREALLKGGNLGPAIVPGDPEKSLLIKAVRQTDPHLQMPMGGKLKDSEIADLTAWVKAGAAWPASSQPVAKSGKYVISPEQKKFWSFLPLHSAPVPEVKDSSWAKTDIDKFILAKLEAQGLKPVKPAPKLELIRRATLDLTGLPPTNGEIEAFEKDDSPEAFAKVVDRLLASQHYGERWGRMWLDVARYGEDDYRSLDPMRRGYNPYPFAYIYRDWVVRAFNDDMRYDTFVRAQLAGDLMDEKDRAHTLPATGFLGLGPWYYDNGAVEVTHADERHDRVDAISRGFLGLTMGCARCHDHKYDPIPSSDYYSFAGIFANTNYREYPQVPTATLERLMQYEKELENKQKLLSEVQTNETNDMAQSLALQTSKYMQAAWKVTGKPKEELAASVEESKLDYELLDRWIKFLAKPPKYYPYLKDWQAMVAKGGSPDEAKKLADAFQEKLISVMFAKNELREENQVIADKALPGTKKKKRANKPNEFVTNDDFCPGCSLQLKTLPLDDMNLWTDVFLRELTDEDAVVQPGVRFKPGLLVFRGWGLQRRLGAEKRDYIQQLTESVDELKKKTEVHYPYLHGVEDAEKPIDLKVSLRGSPYNLGDVAPRHFLSVLSPGDPVPYKDGSGRKELAEDIVKQPIAMRVIVNRVWKGHFTTGIVDTPSNFGVTGERPTNPELLEYLANKFVDEGMSIKKLHREMMLSSVYQLSAEFDKHDFDADSGNRLYWRSNKRRMDAEQIRDSILMVAGNLDDSIGGPSKDLAPAYTRRTLYGKISRYRMDEYLQLFDFPPPNISAEKRFATTVPLQRLFFMNSDFMQAESELLAKRVKSESDNAVKIKKLYELAYGRDPSEQEVNLGLDYLKAEPMQEYEEQKKLEEEKKASAEGKAKRKGAAGKLGSEKASDDKPTDEAADSTSGNDSPMAAGADANAGMGEGMMAGVMGPGGRGRRGATAAPEVKYKPTPLGRYVKVLLSSSEFVYID
jgi:cytochrome c553